MNTIHRSRTLLLAVVLTIGLALAVMATGCGSEVESGLDDAATRELRPEPVNPESHAGFTIGGDTATMSGLIDTGFDADMRALIAQYPNVTTIIFRVAPGSANDDANIAAARVLRDAGLSTKLLATSEIASGAVDLFLAGTTRTIEDGARLGVHSWGGAPAATPAADLPRDHEAHRLYLDYYKSMGIDEEFYWFTLNAAPADNIHWMAPEEIARFKMATTESTRTQTDADEEAP